MARLLDEMKSNQAKTDVNLKEMKEERTAAHELLKHDMLAKMRANQEWMDAKRDVHRERMMAMMDS